MFVIKVGGGENINWNHLCEDLSNLCQKEQVVIVHGASKVRDRIARQLNAPTKTVISPSGISSVYTDKKALEIFLMVYAGLINKQIVAKLQACGIKAVGLSGVDGNLWLARRKSDLFIKENNKLKILKDNLTGKVVDINIDLIKLLLKNGYVPVVCPPAISENHEILNVDGDSAAALMAQKLKAKKLLYLFEAPGLLKDLNDEKSAIKIIPKNNIDDYLQFAQGRMKKKIIGAKQAIEAGVEKIYWGDGRIKNPIINLLKGKGTIIS